MPATVDLSVLAEDSSYRRIWLLSKALESEPFDRALEQHADGADRAGLRLGAAKAGWIGTPIRKSSLAKNSQGAQQYDDT